MTETVPRQRNPHACRTYSGLSDQEKLLLTHADPIAGRTTLTDQTGCEYGMLTTALAHRVSFFIAGGKRVTVCRTGGRAHTMLQIPVQAGFSRVFVLEGGSTAWKAEGLPIE